MDKSVVIHVRTKKGKGYKFAEEDKIGYWHGVGPFDIETGKSLNTNSNELISYSECISNHLEKEMENNKDIIAITPAMISGSKLNNIFNKFKDRAIDLGINEEHAVTFASGLSLNKKKPFLSIYSTFMQRSYDNLNNDLARMNLPLVVGVDRAGLSGEDGDTHLGIYDVEITKGLRNSVIAMPLDSNDAKNILNLAFNSNKLFFIRYPKENVNINDNYNFFNDLEIGKWDILNKGNSDTLIISTGPITKEVNELLKNKYSNLNLIFARFYKPLDKELLLNNLKNIKNLIIYDIYSTKCGLYEDVCAFLIENNININIINMSLPNTPIGHGKINELLIDLKLSINDLENKINEIR
jgi:1-deoxy-D-xylulose-5-phosphate synthase